MTNITRYVWGEYGMYKDTCGDYVDAKEYDRLTAQLADRDAEIDQLRVQLAGCGVAAMCNTRESMQQQLCRKGDYGYSASYQDVVDAVSREIVLREENADLRTKLAECEKEVEKIREANRQLAGAAICPDHLRPENVRKQTAGEIETHLLGMFWTIPYKENEPMIYRDQAIEWIREKFGLEG